MKWNHTLARFLAWKQFRLLTGNKYKKTFIEGFIDGPNGRHRLAKLDNQKLACLTSMVNQFVFWLTTIFDLPVFGQPMGFFWLTVSGLGLDFSGLGPAQCPTIGGRLFGPKGRLAPSQMAGRLGKNGR